MPRNTPQPAAANANAEAGASRLRGAAKSKVTKRPVRSTRTHVRADEQELGQTKPRNMRSQGDAAGSLEESQIETVERPSVEPVSGKMGKKFYDDLKFNEEVLTIMVHETNDPSDDPIPYVINGGIRQAFIRGQEQDVKRKFVEVLARMKRTGYTQERFKDSQQIDQIRNLPHTALRYPFTVINDPNPRGKDWLKGILREAQ